MYMHVHYLCVMFGDFNTLSVILQLLILVPGLPLPWATLRDLQLEEGEICYMYTCTHVHVYTCTHVHMYTYTHVHCKLYTVHTYTCLHVSLPFHDIVCVYTYVAVFYP